MKPKATNSSLQANGIMRILAVTALVLSIPLVAMQFSNDVDWDLFDFAIMGTLLISTGLIYEFVVKKLRTSKQRIIAGIVLLAVLFLIWAELAVGVFGSPFAGS